MKLQKNKERILIIPDLQIPFHHPDAFDFLEFVSEQVDPTRVVSIGDEVDQYGLSKFPQDPDVMSAGDELAVTNRCLSDLYARFPTVDAVMSNHVERVLKRALEAGIPKGYLKDVREFMAAPRGWNWHDSLDICGIRFEHGDGAGGQRAHRVLAEARRCSVVIGHNHSYPGVDYISNGSELIFGMNVGCLIDPDAIAFKYARKARHKPVLSCGVVIHGVPYIVPMITKGNGRWNSKEQLVP